MSGGFLGKIPPYFFFTAASYNKNELKLTVDFQKSILSYQSTNLNLACISKILLNGSQ